MRLIISCVKPFCHKGISFEDLVCYGIIGLDKAIEKFDPTRGVRFTSFAYVWILKPVRVELYRATPVKIPAHQQEHLYRLRHLLTPAVQGMSQEARLAHLTKSLGLTSDHVMELLDLLEYRTVPLEEALYTTTSNIDTKSIFEVLREFSAELGIIIELHGVYGNPKTLLAFAREHGMTVVEAKAHYEQARALLARLLY